MKKALSAGLRTIGLAVGLTIIFIIAVRISGLGQPAASSVSSAATSTGAAAQAQSAPHPANLVLLLFISSLVQAAVAAWLVAQAKWGGWKVTGALFLVVANLWLQTSIESVPYLASRVSPNWTSQTLVTGLISATLFAPLAVFIMGGFRHTPETSGESAHWSAARWVGTLATTTVAFVVLYYLCGYYIAWQNPALRQFYSGTTAIRSFWGQIASIWSSTPWMFPFQAGRSLLFVGLTLPAMRMLRGGAGRVAIGTALMYTAWDGSTGLIMPNPIMPPTVAHSHLIELTVWGLLYGALVGWLVSRKSLARTE